MVQLNQSTEHSIHTNIFIVNSERNYCLFDDDTRQKSAKYYKNLISYHFSKIGV